MKKLVRYCCLHDEVLSRVKKCGKYNCKDCWYYIIEEERKFTEIKKVYKI